MSKYIIEADERSELIQVISVMPNGTVYTNEKSIDELEELNSDYINEHFGSLQDDAYKRGLEHGKAANDKGCEGCECETHKDVTCTMCSNNYMNLWTAKDDKIVVGDEVADKNGYKTIVTYIYGDLFDGLCSDGSTITNLSLYDNHKTGGHFDIDKILDEMKGNNDK